jgi:modification methylase
MPRKSARAIDQEQAPYLPLSRLPHIPATDNEPGAVSVLLKANQVLQQRRWPAPYDHTRHQLILGDARNLSFIPSESVHLVVTSPPYFNLKPYESDAGGHQLGRIDDYEAFLDELDHVWRECARVLVPGGRVCCVIGDILIPRRADGRHRVLPLPSDIQVRSRKHGLDNLTPILWFKIGNRTNEAGGGSSGYYGKPYQPGAIIKNDIEHIVMLRKPGGYRSTPMIQRALSMLQRDEMDAWMRPVWSDIRGASLRDGHPAPFPVEIAKRLIRMFSFAGDKVLDPFAGSGSAAIAAIQAGRNSTSVEIEEEYLGSAVRRAEAEAAKYRKDCHTATVESASKEGAPRTAYRIPEKSESEQPRNQAATHSDLPTQREKGIHSAREIAK